MTDSLTLPAPAKLNLFLHVTGRRSDGYHTLQTAFQLLDWGDTLQFEAEKSGGITVEMPGMALPTEQNLVHRAAQLLQRDGQGVSIHVHKQIPAGGGLGGGSSDAATTLLALNTLWHCGLSVTELATLGAELGADVPVFVHGHSAWAEGVGEQLSPLELPPRWYLIIKPDCAVPTADIFGSEQLTRSTAPITMAAFFRGGTRNDCQPVVRAAFPAVNKALNWLDNFGEARLTGTGSCLFAEYLTQAEAIAVAEQVPAPWQAYCARGVNRSPAHLALEARAGHP